MKRPPGLWILLSAGVLWLSLQDVYGIRATALIFGKSTTSTTTEAPSSASTESTDEETAINTELTNSTSQGNATGPILTGNPQQDYLLDPNLPQELNGYNLSAYPFYKRVPPEGEIDFKCDGLHDGFYASVPHKCQVYHHCLFGKRYDFLCANYTAFDQKTFICQFVSDVDCVNSKKFWHRNDALYEAASTTTTVAPLRSIYTPPPEAGDPGAPRKTPVGARRPYRPTRRRRPQVDYYEDEYYDDEYYDERPRANRGRTRPRPRPRPVYEDDYEEYEEEKPESRRSGGRRRPTYRDRRRNKDRKKQEYDDEDEEVDDRFEDEDFVAANKRQKNEERRKPQLDNDEPERDRKRPAEKRRVPATTREQDPEPDRKPLRKSTRRPINDDYDDELPLSDDSRSYEERPSRKEERKGNRDKDSADNRPIIKPVSGTIYDRPRVAPRINLPVPKNAVDKYAYKPLGGARTTTIAPSAEEEAYDDYEEEPLPKRSKTRPRTTTEGKREKSRHEGQSRQRPRRPDSEESAERGSSKPKYGAARNRFRTTATSKRKPVTEEYYDEEELQEEDIQDRRPSRKNEKKLERPSTTTTSTTTTTPEPPKKEKHDPVMRVIKRPFLPSRGGNPYSARGLQPLGLKASDKSKDENDSAEANSEERHAISQEQGPKNTEGSRQMEEIEEKETPRDVEERKLVFKPSPVVIKVPLRSKYPRPTAEAQELINSEPSHQQIYKSKQDFSGPRTTQNPQIIEKNPLDLNEYDVTLNDALNPTLPNLPVRGFPTGFSAGNDYSYNTFTRPRYVVDPVVSTSAGNYVYANKAVRPQQRFEGVPQGQYSTINGGYRQQGQTQAIYSGY